jgi:hypothetical protein
MEGHSSDKCWVLHLHLRPKCNQGSGVQKGRILESEGGRKGMMLLKELSEMDMNENIDNTDRDRLNRTRGYACDFTRPIIRPRCK